MLGWYGRRMLDAANSVWFTAAFGVSKDLIEPIAKKRNQMRFVLMEKPAPEDQKKRLTADFNRVILSYGVPLGQIYRMKNGKPTARMPVKEFRARQVVLQGGALPPEKRRLRVLRAY
jgi:hypothetical protein